jgi:hypothetical protein
MRRQLADSDRPWFGAAPGRYAFISSRTDELSGSRREASRLEFHSLPNPTADVPVRVARVDRK